MEPAPPSLSDTTAALRRFNRFFTRRTGLLEPRYQGLPLSLVEARVLYEIATGQPILARTIKDELGLDPGYLSRIVGRFDRLGWIVRERGSDARQRPIRLTAAGRSTFAALDRHTSESTAAMIEHLGADQRRVLAASLATAEQLLGGARADVELRTFRAGDMGQITARQAILLRRTL